MSENKIEFSLTPAQQVILIEVAKLLWEGFGKQYAEKFFEWMLSFISDSALVQKMGNIVKAALVPADLDAMKFIIVDDQCKPLEEGQCVDEQGSIIPCKE